MLPQALPCPSVCFPYFSPRPWCVTVPCGCTCLDIKGSVMKCLGAAHTIKGRGVWSQEDANRTWMEFTSISHLAFTQLVASLVGCQSSSQSQLHHLNIEY